MRRNDEIGTDYSAANGIAGNVQRQFETAVASGQPSTLVNALGTAAKSGILTERRRVVGVLQTMGANVAAPMLVAMETARISLAQGRHGEHDQAIAVARTSEMSLRAIWAAIGMVTVDPMACRQCGGARVVASSLVAGATVPCPACAVAPEAAGSA
jgi:hypothetical protein